MAGPCETFGDAKCICFRPDVRHPWTAEASKLAVWGRDQQGRPTIPPLSIDGSRENMLVFIVNLGAEMRAAQKEYFKTRSPAALAKSKALERQFDVMAAEQLNPGLL